MYNYQDFEHHSSIVDENEFFIQYFSEINSWRYDSNFFLLKFQPYLQEFKLIEEMQYVSHHQYQMDFLRFFWPMNTPLTNEIMNYFDKNNYQLEYLKLYQIDPNQFKGKTNDTGIIFETVTSTASLKDFKLFNFPKDKEESVEFAHFKSQFYNRLFEDERYTFVIARQDRQVVGSLIAIENENGKTIEIDDVYTHEDCRHQQVASGLQQVVMEQAIQVDKQVILVADGEDTVYEMYEKQGYEYIGYLIGALKEL